MVKSTPTLGVLVSSIRLWGWGWWWAQQRSQCFRTANWSNCCGLIQLQSKDPSEWLHVPLLSPSLPEYFYPTWEKRQITSSLITELIIVFPSFLSSSVDIVVTKDRSLTVTLKNSVKFVVLLHKVWEKHPYHRNYLGFYTLDSHLLSSSVHGLLGMKHIRQVTVKELLSNVFGIMYCYPMDLSSMILLTCCIGR